MLPPVIKFILIGLGVIFILVGLILAIVTAIKSQKSKTRGISTLGISEFTALIEALTKAPIWLVLIIIGIFLIGYANDPQILSTIFSSSIPTPIPTPAMLK